MAVIVLTILFQYLIVTFGGEFTRTSPLTADEWLETVAFGLISLPIGFLMRFIPVSEDENSFFFDELAMDTTRGSKILYYVVNFVNSFFTVVVIRL